MLTDEIEEKVVERLVRRIEKANSDIIKSIGDVVRKIGKLRPTEAHKLAQMLRYGGDYNKIVKELENVTKLNVKEIDKMFDEVAKKNYEFAEDFYKYRDIPQVPYEKSKLKSYVDDLKEIAEKDYINLTKTSAFRFSGSKGVEYKSIRDTYHDILDTAMINITQGKEDFYSQMRKTLKELVDSGIRTVEYEKKSLRLDSAVRMQLRAGVTNLHNQVQTRIGEELKTDGVEISVHENPAPDHEDVQGRRFKNEEFKKLQEEGKATATNGKEYNIHRMTKYGYAINYRPIGTMNCYHKFFAVILDVEEPEYTDEQLEEIKRKNKEGFEYDGQHYTNYEGTQVQRQLETEIRRLKEEQIMARNSGDEEWLNRVQGEINKVTKTYNDFSKAGNLRMKLDRLNVDGYKFYKVKPVKIDTTKPIVEETRVRSREVEKPKMSLEDEFYMLQGDLGEENIDVKNSIFILKEEEVRNKNLRQLVNLNEKYPHNTLVDMNTQKVLDLRAENVRTNWFAYHNGYRNEIVLNNSYFNNKEKLMSSEKNCINTKWHFPTKNESDLDIYTITHEYGHQIEYDYFGKIRKNRFVTYKDVDKDLRDLLISNAKRISGEKLNMTQFKDKYFSGYAKSKRNFEWFAELFAQHELGYETPFTQALDEWLEAQYGTK